MTTKDNKEPASRKAKEALQQHDEDLLRDIFHQRDIAFSKNDPSQINLTLAYFSALLIKLSRQAEKTTERIIRLTYAMLFVSVVLLFITTGQLIMAFQAAKKPIIVYVKPNEPNNQTDQKDNTKTIHNNDHAKPIIQIQKPKVPIKNETHK